MNIQNFDNWEEKNYKDISLYDNIDVLAESLDILEHEAFYTLYQTRKFWDTNANKLQLLTEFFDLSEDAIEVYGEFSKISGIPPSVICYFIFAFRNAFTGSLKRLPFMEAEGASGFNTDNQGEDPENSADDNDIEMEIQIDQQHHQHQLTPSQPVTTEPSGSTTSAQIPITATGPTQTPKRKNKRKASSRDDNMDDVVTPPSASTTKKIKSKKKVVHKPVKVLTGHTPENADNVGEVLVYDIPIIWSTDKLLSELTLWGKVISINTKPHRKYFSARIKMEFNSFQLAKYRQGEWQVDLGNIPVRWFPANWSLKDRKQYEKFQAVIEDIPPSLVTDQLWINRHHHELLSSQSGLKAFKIVQYEGNRRKLIGYFDNWVNLKNCLGTEMRWETLLLKWCAHLPFSPKVKKSVKSMKHKTSSKKPLDNGNKSNQKKTLKKKGNSESKSTNKNTKKVKQPIPSKSSNSLKGKTKLSGWDKNQMFSLFAEFLSFYNSKK